MKKIFAILFASLFLITGVAFADSYKDDPRGTHDNGNGWGGPPINDNGGPSNGGGCIGSDCGNVTGSLDISTFAAGGGIDLDGKLIPNGAAGGISAAGGLTVGQAAGEVSSIKIFKKVIPLGTVEASINSIGGGLTETHAYKFTPSVGDIGIGVGSSSNGQAVTGAVVDTAVVGFGYVEAVAFGVAGQGSLNGSLIGPSPLGAWDSFGVSYGLAGQGSVGAFVGYAGAVGFGSAGFEANIAMNGGSYSESYRAIDFNGPAKTEIMGTNVGAYTNVNSYGSDYDCGLAAADVNGGWVAGGVATSKTFQIADGGVAKATANGSYSGAGSLNCDFEGSAIGGTQTSATTMQGYNGAIMTSSSAMKVTAKTGKITN
jgi:hypothetical protein